MPLAHAIVDRLLGFDRSFAESRLQLTPVEWGIWTFLFLRALDSFDAGGNRTRTSPLTTHEPGQAELTLDRVGPDPFDPSGLGSIVTVRWPIRVGNIAGAVRLWLPESVVNLWLAAAFDIDDGERRLGRSARKPRSGTEKASWPYQSGRTVQFVASRGRRGDHVSGAEAPAGRWRLTAHGFAVDGTPASPNGLVDLILDLDGQATRFRIPARPVADSGGRLVRVEGELVREPRPRDPIFVTKSETEPMSQPHASPAPPAAMPLDVPVTLTVELGRVNLTLTQLADLKAGDVIELNRHSRAPVELTSNGRLVARGELILIDTDLGVRVTNVFL